MDTKKLRQKILDLAIHGKLVPQDPNDEPASVLLERIRKEKELLIKEGKIKAPKKSKSSGDTSHYPKDVPFEVPEGWVWSTIGELCTVFSAKRVHQSDWRKEGIPFYRAREIVKLSEQGYVENDLFISEMLYDGFISTGLMPAPGDIMISAVGTIGKTYIVRATDRFYFKDASVLCLKNPYLNPAYLDLYLQSSLARAQMHNGSKGTTVDTITIEKAAEFLIPIPPSSEQKRIVSYMDSIEPIIVSIESKKKSIESLIEKTKNKILDLAIHGKLVPQAPSDEPAIELLKRINPDFKPSHNLHYEDIPQSWAVCRLSDVCSDFIVPQRDKPRVFDGDIPWCRIEDIEGKYLNGSLSGRLVSKKTIQQMNMRICPVGTVICSCSASIGTQAIVTRPCCTNQTFIGLVPNVRFIYNEFLYYFLASQTEQFLDIGTGTTIKYISREKFEEYRIPLPPLAEQRRIVERIEHYLLLLKQIKSATSPC